MYCPVDIMSPFFTLEMKGKQCSKGVFVSPVILYSLDHYKSLRNVFL